MDRREKIYLTAITVLSIIARFSFISRRSIWHDEGFTTMIINFSPLEIIRRTALDVHPPLYYLLLHYWAKIFGNSELALRGMSAVLGVGVVLFVYVIVKKLFNQETAKWATLFTALGPFLIRYSQEARMWNLVAFLATASTYFLIKALEDKKYTWWILYATSLSLAAYTQYFSLLVLMPHWIYVLLKSLPWRKEKIKSIAFSFWIPKLIAQMSRVSGGYWIQKSWMTIRTVPSTLYQFLAYANFDHFGPFNIPNYIHELILLLIIAATIYILIKNKERWREIIFVLSYFLIPMYFIFAYSLIRTPIYQDRYFVFTSIALYSFLALIITAFTSWKKNIAGVVFIAILIFGIFRVNTTENHGMREVNDFIKNGYGIGDEIAAGELYVYFDASYYNKTDETLKLYADPNSIRQGFGESSLIYDQTDKIVINDLTKLNPESNRVWLIGKPWRDYYKKIPSHWQELKNFKKDDSAVTLYKTN